MKKIVILIFNLIFITFILGSCNKETKKPYGAIDIEYGKVEEFNIEGPVLDELHDENTPPSAPFSYSLTDEGPRQNEETENYEPTADIDSEPDYGGIPIVTKASVS